MDVVAFFAEGDFKQARVKIDQLVKDNIIPGGFIKLGARNMRVQDRGAYTDHAPSLAQLKDWGVEAVLLGHSEIATADRGEPSYVDPDELIARKVEAAVNVGLRVILAYGETRNENDAGRTEEVLTRRLTARLSRVTGEQMLKNQMVLAYEPVWAIGEGAKSAST
jgi:triosephosphate isomerase